jgi:uncharacterized membrane protein YfcA
MFMNFPLITDPFFYLIAVPAVLLLGVSKSGFGAGFGSLAVPMMALAVTVPQAAAILMPVLLVMDLLGLAAFRKDVDRALLRFMVPFAMVGIVLGALLFKLLDAQRVAAIVGAFTLLFLAQQMLFKPDPNGPPPPRWLGGLLLITAGFTSFIAHAGGPPINAYVIPLKLKPVLFTGTLAFFFFFIIFLVFFTITRLIFTKTFSLFFFFFRIFLVFFTISRLIFKKTFSLFFFFFQIFLIFFTKGRFSFFFKF